MTFITQLSFFSLKREEKGHKYKVSVGLNKSAVHRTKKQLEDKNAECRHLKFTEPRFGGTKTQKFNLETADRM